MLTYLLAVLAACANATSSVLQRKANRDISQNQNMSLRLIRSLLHRPVWFGGVLAVIAGFLLQATALGTGQLAVVEPILVLELPATLILGSRVFRARLGWREWVPTAAMTAGLAGLLFFLSPSSGHSTGQSWYVWLMAVGGNVAVIGALVAWGRRGPAGHAGGHGSTTAQAAVLGVAAGAAFGLTAALMKGMTNAFGNGFVALFTSWQLYAMIVAGGFGMFLLQSAMNAGPLIAAQPGLTLTDPIVSILWGILVFGERVQGGLYLLLAVLGGLMIVAAVVMLSRSPLLAGGSGSAGDQPDGGRGAGRPRAGDRPDRAADGSGRPADRGRTSSQLRRERPADGGRGRRSGAETRR